VNIIDTFVVRFGFDTSDTKRGSDETRDHLKKVKDEASKTGKEIGETAKHASEFVRELRGQVIELFLAFTGGKALKEFAEDVFKSDAATGRLARILGVTTQQLGMWQNAARLAGGSAESVAASMAAFDRQLVNISLIPEQGKAVLPYLRALGVSLRGANGQIMGVMEAIPRLRKAVQDRHLDPRRASSLLAGLGLDPTLINLVLMEEKKYQAMMAKAAHYAPTKGETDMAERVQTAWSGTTLALEKLQSTMNEKLGPTLVSIMGRIEHIFDYLGQHEEEANRVFTAMAVGATAVGVALFGWIAIIPALIAGILLLWDDWSTWTEGGKSKFGDFYQAVADWWREISAIAIRTWNDIKGVMVPIFEWMWKTINDTLAVYSSVLNLIYQLFFGKAEDIKRAWSQMIGSMERLFKDWWTGLPAMIANVGPAVWDAVKYVFGRAFDWVTDRANTIWRAITGEDLFKTNGPFDKQSGKVGGAVKEGVVGGGGGAVNPASMAQLQKDIRTLQGMGWTKEQAIGIVANESRESSGDINAVGDNGRSKGLFQWDAGRRAMFQKVFGYDMMDKTIDAEKRRLDQLKFITHELRTGSDPQSGTAGRQIAIMKNSGDVAAAFSTQVERPLHPGEEAAIRRGRADDLEKHYNDLTPEEKTSALKKLPAGATAGAGAGAAIAARDTTTTTTNNTIQKGQGSSIYMGPVTITGVSDPDAVARALWEKVSEAKAEATATAQVGGTN